MLSEKEKIQNLIVRLMDLLRKFIDNYKKEVRLNDAFGCIAPKLSPYYMQLENLYKNMEEDLRSEVPQTLTSTYNVYLTSLNRLVKNVKSDITTTIAHRFWCCYVRKNIDDSDKKNFAENLKVELIQKFTQIKEEVIKNPEKVDVQKFLASIQKSQSTNEGPPNENRNKDTSPIKKTKQEVTSSDSESSEVSLVFN